MVLEVGVSESGLTTPSDGSKRPVQIAVTIKIERNKPNIVVRSWELCDATRTPESRITRHRMKGQFALFYLLEPSLFLVNSKRSSAVPGGERNFVITKDYLEILPRKVWRLQK